METNNNLALYAAIKTFFKDDQDPWSAVSVFTLLIIEDGDSMDTIQTKFSDKYKIDIPGDALQTIISRLRRNHMVTYQSFSSISLTEEGKSTIVEQNKSVSSVRREFGALIKDLKAYLKKQGVSKIENVEQGLLNFIDDNIGFTSRVMSGKSGKSDSGSYIAKYIIEVEQSNPTIYKVLQNVFFGRVFLSLIRARADIDVKAKFDKLTIYLDTNILFNLLGLHGDQAKKSSDELLKILNTQQNLEVSVFDITINEALSVLNAYVSQSGNYTNAIKVDSIYSRFKSLNMNRHDIQLLIENFEKNTEKLGIRISKAGKLDEDLLKNAVSGLSSAAQRINQFKNDKAIEHDAWAIEHVSLQRKGTRTKLLEKSRSIFITADRSVYDYSIELATQTNNFPLALRPVDIVSLLWMKNIGDKEVGASALRHVVMGYARERTISHNLWEEFTAQLTDAAKKGDISKEDIALIMSSDETERILIDDQRNGPKKIINQSHVRKLKKEREDTYLAKEKAENKLEKLDKKINNFSRIIAWAGSLLFWSVLLVLLTFFIKWIISQLGGINAYASWVEALVFPVLALSALLFGKDFKFTNRIVEVRNNIFKSIRRKTYSLLKRLLGI